MSTEGTSAPDSTDAPESTPAAESAGESAEGAPSRRRRMAGAFGRGSRRLADGIPTGFVAALAVLVLVAILFTVATRGEEGPRGYTELTLFPEVCQIDAARAISVEACQVVGPRAYRVSFTRSLRGSTPIVSRGSCCAGSVGASADSDRTVLIALGQRVKPKKPVRVSVLVP
jgi:hypothetical protein